ncbi:MAG: M20 family metallopeptidase [Acidobacteriota bacterium]
MEPNEILEYFRSRTGDIVAAIREIVDIESPSHDSNGSREVVDWVETQARATGVEVSIERVFVADGNHLIIKAFPAQYRPTLLLGHTDTVHPLGSSVANPTRVDGDRLYGCGVFDMKANIVVMLEALRYLDIVGESPVTPITIVLSCDEEVGSHTGREIVEDAAVTAGRCFVLEPSSNGRLKTGRKGTAMFTLNAHGIPAHAGLEPEKGANAILELSKQIEIIQSVGMAEKGTTVNVCKIKGGTTSNVIPEFADCEIDVRFASMAEAERVESELRSIGPFNDRVKLELTGAINRPPLERTDAVVELFEKAKALASSFGYDIGETQVGGASDGNFVAALGIPVVDGLGVAGGGAHTLDEYIEISDIANRATLLTLLLMTA